MSELDSRKSERPDPEFPASGTSGNGSRPPLRKGGTSVHMAMDETSAACSYRDLHESEEESHHESVALPMHVHTHTNAMPRNAAASSDRSSSAETVAATAPTAVTTYDALDCELEPTDWSSEEGAIRDLNLPARRHTMRAIEHVIELSNGVASISQHETDHAPSVADGNVTPLLPPAPPSRSVSIGTQRHVVKQPLHGKDLQQYVSIRSLDRVARQSSIEWLEKASSQNEPDYLSLMDPYYDITKSKLTKIFSLFHPDDEGMVTYVGFRRGLEAMGIIFDDEDDFQAFIVQIDEDHSGGISCDEFEKAIQEIKLAQLFNDDFIQQMGLGGPSKTTTSCVLGSVEYSPDRIRSVYPIHNHEKFLYSTKPQWASVRWINVDGYDALSIRRLAVRYRLHPLAVEDALDIERERPKYEQYDDHSTLILQIVHPVDPSKVLKYQRMYRNSLYVSDNSRSEFDDMSKKELEERLHELQGCKIMTHPEQLSVYVLKDVLITIQEHQSELWSIVKARLDRSYSKLRHQGTPFLAYSIVDTCVDDLTPIVHTLGAKLVMLERLLGLDPKHFDVTRLHICAKQVKGLKRLCRPLNEVIMQMSVSRDFTGEILRYFRDVQDHVAIIDEDCDKHLDTCRTLIEQFHNVRAAQQGDVSYLLTLVAAIFLPAQFLTGLYGMNFVNMPELQYHYGYYLWWVALLTIAAGIIIYFRFFRRWL